MKIVLGLVCLIAVVAALSKAGDDNKVSGATGGSKPVSSMTADGKSHVGSAASSSSSSASEITVGDSSCLFTGVSDAYTGDGKVVFLFTLRNSGSTEDVSVTPVRHYSDGGTNESAMDAMSATVPGYSSKRYASGQMTYEAHAHEVVSCGLRLDSGAEIPIRAEHA